MTWQLSGERLGSRANIFARPEITDIENLFGKIDLPVCHVIYHLMISPIVFYILRCNIAIQKANSPITVRERFILLLLGAPLILIGVMPGIMAPMLESGVRPVLALLGGA